MDDFRPDPTGVIAALKDLARASFVDTFPDIPEEETIEGEAAILIAAMVEDFRRIAAGAPDGVAIAQKWVDNTDPEDEA